MSSKTTLAIKEDGTLWGWGSLYYFASKYSQKHTTPTLVNDDKDWDYIAPNDVASLLLKRDGTLWGWGTFENGTFPDGSTQNTKKEIPEQIGDSLWKMVAFDSLSGYGIKKDGTLWSWGQNISGCLGIGYDSSAIIKYTPVQIGSNNDWVDIAVSLNFCMAINTRGELYGWGYNGTGQLGTSNSNTMVRPILIEGSSEWKKVSTGSSHTLALKTDGTLWATGRNQNGQLGIGNTSNSSVFKQVGDDKDWADVSANSSFSLGLKKNGSLYAWGQGTSGQLGNGSYINMITSPERIGQENEWATIETGDNFVKAIKKDGTLWTWGINSYGQIGDGTTNTSYEPKIIEPLSKWISLENEHIPIPITNKYLFKDGNEIKKYEKGSSGGYVKSSLEGTPVANGARQPVVNAFDDDPITYWTSQNVGESLITDDWIGFKFNEPKTINKIRVTNYNYGTTIKKGNIDASNDGINWTTLKEGIIFSNEDPKEIELINESSYFYYRLKATDYPFNGATTYWFVKEIELYELIEATPTGWQSIGNAPATKAMFDEHGMKDLSAIDDAAIQSLVSDQVEILCWTDEEEAPNRTGIIKSIPKPQLIKQEADMILPAQVESLTLDYSKTGDSILRLIASNDSALTWNTLSESNWVEVDSENMEDVASNGITAEDFNSITPEEWKSFITDSKIRFAYYLDISSEEDELSLNNLSYQLVGGVDVSPQLKGINIRYDEITIEGRLKELEKLNAVNIAKLNFKSNALIQSERYEMHDMIVDTCEEEDMIAVSSSGAGEKVTTGISFSTPVVLGFGKISELNLSQLGDFKKVKVK